MRLPPAPDRETRIGLAAHRHRSGQVGRPQTIIRSAEPTPVGLPSDFPPVTVHPLDPLNADEFRAASAILKREKGVGPGLALRLDRDGRAVEGRREQFEADGTVPERRARLVGAGTAATERDLHRGAVVTGIRCPAGVDPRPDVQPNFTVDEWEEADAAMRAHPDVIAALANRGITDLELVFMDTWTYGAAVIPEKYKGRRLGWSDTWVESQPGANPYAGPVTGSTA